MAPAFPVAQVGQYVRITNTVSALAAQQALIGQVRRIISIAGTTCTVDATWFDENVAPVAVAPLTGTSFEVIREAIGPFYATSYAAGTKRLTVSGIPASQPAGSTASFYTGISGVPNVADVCYGAATNGPCYVHIISGPGAGQIRRIATAAEAAAATGMVSDGANSVEIEFVTGFSVVPTADSQFVFINAVPKHTGGVPDAPTATGSAATGEGAVGIISGAAGISNSLVLSARPGYGEANGSGGWIGPAGAAALRLGGGGDWDFTLSVNLNVNALVNAINLSNVITGATKNAATADGAWKARVGLGRDGALLTSSFDWTGSDTTNGAVGTSDGVDCLCDFATTNPSADGDYSGTPNRYHRFVDNLALLINTINTQSSLITAARSTVAGTPAGVNFGDGVPAFKTYALGSGAGAVAGAYNATTAASLDACFDELIKHRHNTEVALWSTNTANFSIDYVHSLLATNAKNGAGAYNNEVDCIASLTPNASLSLNDALTEIKTYSTVLNDRNVALTFQNIKRPGLTGFITEFPPHMLACAIAGMQAGSTVGTPLTFKLVRANEILCANTRVDTLDKTTSDDLLLSGLLFTEKIKGQGYRITRNLSTYTATDNLAYTDRHVNYELNFMAYDLRTFVVDKFIGVKATPATVASIKSAVISKLDYYKNGIEIIVDSQDPATGEPQNAYKNINITISGDICTIRFEIFPAVGINYITFEIFAKLPTLSA